MLAAYNSGDPYLKFAEQARALTEAEVEAYQNYKQDDGEKSDATERAEQVRGPYKQTSLAVLYGMGEHSLAVRLGLPRLNAAGAAAGSPTNLRAFLELVRRSGRPSRPRRLHPHGRRVVDVRRQKGAGADASETSRCRRTAPTFFASLSCCSIATVSRSSRPYTMRCLSRPTFTTSTEPWR